MTTQLQSASAPITFTFDTASSVRIVLRDGEPWFVVKDVAEALDYPATTIKNTAKLVGHVPNEWKDRYPIPTPGGDQEMLVLAELGLYFFLNRSDKPKAFPFQKRAAEILVQIRKTGKYEAPPMAAEELISPAQVAELRRLVWILGGCYHMKNAGEWAAFAMIRETFGVENAYKLPARRFQEALELLQWAERTSLEFKCRVIDIERQFMRSRFKICPPELQQLAQIEPTSFLFP